MRWARRCSSWTRRPPSCCPGYATELNGVSREFRSSSGALGLVFVLALMFIFLVLSAQFELRRPLRHPAGGAAVDGRCAGGMTWTGGTLNVYSQIGLITLVG